MSDFDEVIERLGRARSYWLVSAGPEGPHAAPVWGAVHEAALHHFSDRTSVKARQVAQDPRVVVHLESAEEVLIVEGRLVDLGHPLSHPEVLGAFEAKYDGPGEADYLPGPTSPYDVLYRLEPTRVMSWDLADFDGSQRRWGRPGAPLEG